jgi:hypothetical protein
MLKLIIKLGCILAPFSIVAVAAPALATDIPTILIMSEYVDAEGVPHKSKLSMRILDSVVNNLRSKSIETKFEVYKESELGKSANRRARLSSFAARRTDAKLINFARGFRSPPFDAIIFLTVHSNILRKPNRNELSLQIEGRILNVQDGRRLSSWREDSPHHWSVRNECFFDTTSVNESCLVRRIDGEVPRISGEISSLITNKLTKLITGGWVRKSHSNHYTKEQYTIVFDGFDSRAVRDFEEYLVVFSGYFDHHPTEAMTDHVEFLYESGIPVTALRRNLEKMMEILEYKYTLIFQDRKFILRNKNLFKNEPNLTDRRDNGRW